MDSGYFEILDPYWWLGVVVLSIVLNIVAAYIKPSLDSITSRYSSRRKLRLEKQRQKFDWMVKELKGDKDLQLELRFMLFYDYLAIMAIGVSVNWLLPIIFSVSMQFIFFGILKSNPDNLEFWATMIFTVMPVIAILFLINRIELRHRLLSAVSQWRRYERR